MKTFIQFITEKQHWIKHYKDWGVVHPTTGRLISGQKHKSAWDHRGLKFGHKGWEYAPEYAHIDYPNGDNGHLMIRSVHNDNKHVVLKAYDNLPHHPSDRVTVNGKEGNSKAMYNHLKNADFSKFENR